MKLTSLIAVAVALVVLFFVAGNIIAAPVADFSHTDSNPYSPRSGQSVGPYDAVNGGTVTMWYHQYNKY